MSLKRLPPPNDTQDDDDDGSDGQRQQVHHQQRQAFHQDNVPWQRVVNFKGCISPRGGNGDGAARQAEALRGEGVEVHRNSMGEYFVDLREYGWFPDELESV